jgi:23S rRNA (uracil747-C5)-methyltransferase
MLETDYDQQIFLKEETLKSALGITELEPTIRSEISGFRNKAKIVVSGSAESPILGLLEKEILNCPVHDPVINKILHDLIPFIRLAKMVPYNIAEKKGELKGIILFHGDETYVRFVLRSKEGLDRIKKNLPFLLSSHPEITSVSVNIQPVHQAILEGDEEINLGPKNYIQQSFGNLKLRLRPQAFVQTNQQVAANLYETAAEWVKEKGVQRFLELFSGQGAFSFHCAGFVKEATGVEINSEAVAMATETASELGLFHLKFISLDAGKSAEIIRDKNPQLILVNPPRRGLGESLPIFKNSHADWMIYSSCSVESLKKDIEDLSSHYEVVKARLFDMFPHTAHFETLVLLRRLPAIKT